MTESKDNFAFTFHNVHITKLDWKFDFLGEGQSSTQLSFFIEVDFNKLEEEADSRLFGVFFKISIKDEEDTLFLSIVAVGVFEAIQNITDEYLKDSNVKIGAPIIAYPYVRAAIGSITTNCGFNPITMPLMNFPQFFADQEDTVEEN